MNDIINAEFEARVRAAMHTLAETHSPAAPTTAGLASAGRAPSGRRWLLAAAAGLLVAVGIGALAVVSSDDEDAARVATPPSNEPATNDPRTTDPTDTEPTGTAPADALPIDTAPVALPPSATPNLAGDAPIDVTTLRFAEPLPTDVVAFINAPDERQPPEVEPVVRIEDPLGPDDPPDELGFIALDGPRRLMNGFVVDLPPDSGIEITGEPVDVGVDGARYVDSDEGAIVVPVGDGLRLVAPSEFVSFFGGGPYVDPEVLEATARLIGTMPMADVAELDGLVVYDGTIDGATVDPLGVGVAPTVRHGGAVGDVPSATVYRLADAPTELELIGIANVFAQELQRPAAQGDLAFWGEPSIYVELVSPVDLLVVRYGADAGNVAAIDFTSVDDLDATFDGTIDAPPAPPGSEQP